MFRKTIAVLAFAVAACVLPGEALARGSGRIPCLSEEVIKVADVPRDVGMALAAQWGENLNRIRPGYGLDLGYRFQPCSASGRWVGYIGYSETDFELDDQQLRQLASAAGMSDLPPTPGIWKNPDIQLLTFGGCGAVLFLLIRLWAKARSTG